MPSIVSKERLIQGLRALGVREGMALEVHTSLRSLGYVEGGAETVLEALMEAVGPEGTLVMPAFCLSPNQPLTDEDRRLGLTVKIRLLEPDAPRSAMGLVADTFRMRPDVAVGEGLFRVAAWGRDAALYAREGFARLVREGGYALLLGVDIYRLSAMHTAEGAMPDAIRQRFAPSREAREVYPEAEWMIEAWTPETRPWYTIQRRAFEKGVIHEGKIGDSRCMFFRAADVVGLYAEALRTEPFALYGLDPQ